MHVAKCTWMTACSSTQQVFKSRKNCRSLQNSAASTAQIEKLLMKYASNFTNSVLTPSHACGKMHLLWSAQGHIYWRMPSKPQQSLGRFANTKTGNPGRIQKTRTHSPKNNRTLDASCPGCGGRASRSLRVSPAPRWGQPQAGP